MASPSLALKQYTPENLPYTRDDLLEAQDVVDEIVAFGKKRERETAWNSRYSSRNPNCPPDIAVAHVLDPHDELEEIVQGLVLRELQRRGFVDLCLAAYDWFLGNCETPTHSHFYDAALYACASHYSKGEKALSILDDCTAIGVKPTVLTYNMLISSFSHSGKWEQAFNLFDRAVGEGIVPNTFTVDQLMRSCNFKRQGHWERAMSAVAKLQEQGELPATLVDSLLDVSAAAMHRAARWQDAMAVFVGLQRLGLECNTLAFNTLIKSCAKHRAWEKAIAAFEHMIRLRVPATTETYNALIRACHRGSQPAKVLEIFEWMVEGRGADEPVGADTETYNILIAACHERGMLEKGLEILAWMQGSQIELNSATYDELLGTLEVAEMWDKKGNGTEAAQPRPSGKGLTTSYKKRDSPFDGMRMLYMEDQGGRFVEELLSQEKLGMETWAPPTMRPAPKPAKQQLVNRAVEDFIETHYQGITMGPPLSSKATYLPPVSAKNSSYRT